LEEEKLKEAKEPTREHRTIAYDYFSIDPPIANRLRQKLFADGYTRTSISWINMRLRERAEVYAAYRDKYFPRDVMV